MSRSASLPHSAGARRSTRGGLSLELQASIKFGLAFLIAIAGFVLAVSQPASLAVVPLGAVLGARALSVIRASDAPVPGTGPQGHAVWDGWFAVAFGAVAIALLLSGVTAAAALSAIAAMVVAVLRLSTRYVS